MNDSKLPEGQALAPLSAGSPAVRAAADLANRPSDGPLVLTTDEVPAGYRVVRTVGLVRGNTIRARHVGKDIMAAFRTLVGGEITEYTKLMAESREHGVVDASCQVFGHRNLYVCDASVIPYAMAVNPALTVSAIAEKTAAAIIERG